VGSCCAGRPIGANRQNFEPDAEDHDEHDAGDEFRQDRRRQTDYTDDAVDETAGMQRGPDPARDTERHDEHEGKGAELHRIPESGENEGRDRRAIGVGLAHVAHRKMTDPVPILNQ